MTTNIPDPKSLSPADMPWARALTEWARSMQRGEVRRSNDMVIINRDIATAATVSGEQTNTINEIGLLTGAGADVTLGVPTAPVLSSGLGSIVALWDGMYEPFVPDPENPDATAPDPAQIGYIQAQASLTDVPEDYINVGTPFRTTGTQFLGSQIGAAVGQTVYVRFVPFKTGGIEQGTPSASASIPLEGVDIPDLSGEIGDIIDTVDGLNKIFYEPLESTPVAHANADLWFVVDPGTSSVVGVRIWNGIDWVPYVFVADSVFVPGSVGTISLADGAITAPKVATKSLTAEQIAAGTISVNELTPNIGSFLDITINPAIGSVQEGLEQQQRRFRFDDEGLEIGDPTTNEALRLTPGRIEMVQGNTVPTWWEAQNFYVDRMIVNAANIGSHRFESYANGRTVIRPLRGI